MNSSALAKDVCERCGSELAGEHLVYCSRCGIPCVTPTKILCTPIEARVPNRSAVAHKAKPASDEAPASGNCVSIAMTGGSRRGETITVGDHRILILGRCPQNDLAVPDEFASWHHLMLEVNPPWVCLRDLSSLNGVFVNGDRVGGMFGPYKNHSHDVSFSRRLRDGDLVSAGINEFIVHVQSNALATVYSEWFDPFRGIPSYAIGTPRLDDGPGCAYRGAKMAGRVPVIMRILNPVSRLDDHAAEFVREKLREIHAVQSPHVRPFLDAGVHDGWCWVAMADRDDAEHLARARGGRIDWRELLPVLLGAVQGLADAHAAGMTHLDIRPSAIEIIEDGRSGQLRGLGLARLVEQCTFQPFVYTGDDARNLDFTARERITRFGEVTTASDVWSIAACAYFLLTGCSPRYTALGDDPVCTLLESDAVPILDRHVDVPPAFADILDKALHSDLASRYPDAGALLAALRACAKSLGLVELA